MKLVPSSFWPFLRKAEKPKLWQHRLCILAGGLLLLIALMAGGSWFCSHQYHLARIAMEGERFADARQNIGWCLTLWPRDTKTFLLAARIDRLDGQYESASAFIDKAEQILGKPNEDTQFERVLLRAQWGELQEVESGLKFCIEKNHPEKEMILETLALATFKDRNYRSALSYLDAWLKLDPDNVRALDRRGQVYEKLSLRNSAAKDFQHGLDLDPTRTGIRFRLANLLVEDGNPMPALKHYEYLQQRLPSHAEVYIGMGRCYVLLGEMDKALDVTRKGLELDPNQPVGFLTLGKIQMQRGNPGEAEKEIRKSLRLDKTDYQANYALFQALQMQKGQGKEAAQQLKFCQDLKKDIDRLAKLDLELEIHPRDANIPYEIGVICKRLSENPSTCLYWFDQALQRDPQHVPTHDQLYRFYQERNQPEKADRHLPFLKKGNQPSP